MPFMDDITPNPPTGPLVVALAYDGLCTFEYAIVAEIFGLARPELGEGWYRFATCAAEAGPLRAHGGLRFEVGDGPELLAEADLIVVPGWKGADVTVPQAIVDTLLAAYDRGARVASICSGAFVLAATGLLDGRRAATHWRYADALRRIRPAIEVDADVLYVADGRCMTSAGSAAGIDLMLHVVREDFGHEAANSVARRLVMQPHRNGGQAQFLERPIPVAREIRLAPLMDAIRLKPAFDWSVPLMAREAAMSERTFVRRFTGAVGETPGAWLQTVRVTEAQRLLEATTLRIDDVAHRAGFGTVGAMRHHFERRVGLTPSEYRSRFQQLERRA